MDQIERLENQAIDAAIKSDWGQAIDLNSQILEFDKKNVQAILRIAYAYLQTASYENAKKYYHKALRAQPKNSVAHQYLEKIEILEKGSSKPQTQKSFNPHLFIESFGKTKTATLANLGQKQVLAQLSIGQQVVLKIKKRRVEVRTNEDEYVGTLADDISKRLILFIKAKSTYTAYIKEVSLTKVFVFIREDKKGRTVSHHISFPVNLQKNIEQIGDPNHPGTEERAEEAEEDGEEDTSINDWEKMVAEQTEEKEELLDIHPEDLKDDDEDEE